jgi:hypothetical protein
MSLKVMVLESDHDVADLAIRELGDAGHEVLRCHEPGAPAFPCNGVAEKVACPLQAHVVDVALVVRGAHRSQPTALEGGVGCAVMHRVPLVVAGDSVLDPFAAYEARVVDRTADVVGACEEAAESELPQHSRIATDALRAARAHLDALMRAQVSVTRRHGSLLATVTGLGSLSREQRDAAVIRMTAKLRAYDSSARGLDVVVED